MKINTKLLFLCIISTSPIIGMENKDVWTLIVATSTEKNIFREVCKGLQAISHKNNPELYLCKNLVLDKQQQNYALELAAYKRLPKLFNHLLDMGFMYDTQHDTLQIPFCTITQYNDPFTNSFQLSFPYPKYLCAAYLGDIDYVQDYCKNPSNTLTRTLARGDNALHLAIFGGHTNISTLIINHSPGLIEGHCSQLPTPLFLACQKGMTAIVKLLLANKATTKCSFSSFSCLHIASQFGYVDIVKLLIAHDPELLNIRTEENATSLYLASQCGKEKCVQFVLKKNAATTHLFKHSFSCLYVAVDREHTNITQLLLQHSPALINVCEPYKSSPLHVSVNKNNKKITQILLSTNDIDVSIANADKKTPLDYAIDNNHQEMIQLLREHGAQTCAELKQDNNCSVM